MTITITKQLGFDAAHRLLNHEGKCRNLHGHRYELALTVAGPKLDEVGRVVDFGVIKSVVGGWIDHHLDHGFISHAEDPIRLSLSASDSKIHILPPGLVSTAEHLAEYIGRVAESLLRPYRLTVVQVDLWETPTSRATWVRE